MKTSSTALALDGCDDVSANSRPPFDLSAIRRAVLTAPLPSAVEPTECQLRARLANAESDYRHIADELGDVTLELQFALARATSAEGRARFLENDVRREARRAEQAESRARAADGQIRTLRHEAIELRHGRGR